MVSMGATAALIVTSVFTIDRGGWMICANERYVKWLSAVGEPRRDALLLDVRAARQGPRERSEEFRKSGGEAYRRA
jgi:hypothetical protein